MRRYVNDSFDMTSRFDPSGQIGSGRPRPSRVRPLVCTAAEIHYDGKPTSPHDAPPYLVRIPACRGSSWPAPIVASVPHEFSHVSAPHPAAQVDATP